MLLWRAFLADLAGQFYLTWCCPLQLAAVSAMQYLLWRYLSGERFLGASLVMGCCLSTLLQSEWKIYGSCVKGFYWNHSINSWNLQKQRIWRYTVYPSQNPASSHHTQCVYVHTSWSPPPMAGPDKNPRDIDSCNKPCTWAWKYM